MWKYAWVWPVLITVSCGYKIVGWSSTGFTTLAILPVKGTAVTRELTTRMRDALIERCLAGSALKPTDHQGDLTLECELLAYTERTIATDVDGRIERIQFTLISSFVLADSRGKVLWSLPNYQYSDQYAISTGREAYREETVFVQDQAMRTIADLVITNLNLTVTELEDHHE